METTLVYWDYTGIMENGNYYRYWDYIGIMRNYYSIFGLYRDNGRENGNYYSILGLYRDNGKENGNYHTMLEILSQTAGPGCASARVGRPRQTKTSCSSKASCCYGSARGPGE